MQKIYQGAEAIISKDKGDIVKERVKKGYRIKEIDEKLRTRRTRLESRLIREARRAGLATPQILDEDKFTIRMEFIDGGKVKDILDKANYKKIAKLMGRSIAILHNYNIIHGDLTTSNMIIKWKNNVSNGTKNEKQEALLYFIDFGLGFTSTRLEDKATDLHVLKEAIESAHFQVFESMWKVVVSAYTEGYEKAAEVIKALAKIEKRGRYADR
ncbi:MAG: KEOPS complex kinase/ATPase Bud32 [Candidatus Aenigmarchaeota archaeon]|nr:KEOPS complex kinase/ATPase Bud32 [Candidatus Aenigmarchaeota archaeon]